MADLPQKKFLRIQKIIHLCHGEVNFLRAPLFVCTIEKVSGVISDHPQIVA